MTQHRARYQWLWLALFVLCAVATLIDWSDGYSAKTLSSALLAGAFGLLALELPRRLRGGWLVVFGLISIAIAALAYRLARWISTGS